MTNDRKTALGWAQPSPDQQWPQGTATHQGESLPYPNQAPPAGQGYGGYVYPPSQHPYAQQPQQPGYLPPPDYAQQQQQLPPPDYAQQPPGYAPPPSPYPQYTQQQYAHARLQHLQDQAPPYSHVQLPPQPPPSSPGAKDTKSSAPARPIQKADSGSRRMRFIKLTYLHLFAAILVFTGLLHTLMTNATLVARVSTPLTTFALGGRWNWGVVLAAFMAISWVADYWASHSTSKATQYLGLVFYIVAESLIFVPLMAIVEWKTQAILAGGGSEPHIVRDAAFVTLGIFTMLTLSVVVSKKDFSFLRGGLATASGAALSLIVLSLMFGFNLGLLFSVAMVLLAAGYVLYQTSQVLAHYHPGQHVAAALALFSSVALMFWYVIRIFLRARN